MADIFQKPKRKSRKVSSASCKEDHGVDEVDSVLEMAKGVFPKLDIVLKKLEVRNNLTALKAFKAISKT